MALNAPCEGNQPADESALLSWNYSFSDATFLGFFLFFFSGILFSATANGILFFLTVRHQLLLWQPQYIMLRNISACGLGMTFLIAFVVLTSLIQKQTQIYGYWCVAQFCGLRCFFLTSQMTLALMALERYVFVCHGIHYLRVINTHSVRVSLGLIWLVSGAVSFHAGSVLSNIQCGFQQQTSGLMCDAVTIKEHITLSREEDILVFGPPGVILTSCILAICYCYWCMYHAALRVSITLKCNNRRANRTVGLYFLMFLLQLTFNIFYAILTLMGKTKTSPYRMITSTVTPLLIIVPSCIKAAFLLTRNPQIKGLLLSASHQESRSSIREVAGVEVLQHSRGADAVGERECRFESVPPTPPALPGYVVSSMAEDC